MALVNLVENLQLTKTKKKNKKEKEVMNRKRKSSVSPACKEHLPTNATALKLNPREEDALIQRDCRLKKAPLQANYSNLQAFSVFLIFFC